MKNLVRIAMTAGLIFIFYIIANFGSAFLVGVLTQIGGNIKLVGIQLSFDPLITIAYLMLFYFNTLFYQPSPKAQHALFLFTLFLSFTVSFIQGSIFLSIFYWLLKKAKII